jgi:hypothetical protein
VRAREREREREMAKRDYGRGVLHDSTTARHVMIVVPEKRVSKSIGLSNVGRMIACIGLDSLYVNVEVILITKVGRESGLQAYIHAPNACSHTDGGLNARLALTL